jgi:hypothetical protein
MELESILGSKSDQSLVIDDLWGCTFAVIEIASFRIHNCRQKISLVYEARIKEACLFILKLRGST